MSSFIRPSSRAAMFGLALSLAATAPVLATSQDEADLKALESQIQRLPKP